MNDALRFGKMVSYGTMLLLTWSFMPMMLPPAYSQPKEPVPVEPGFRSPRSLCRWNRGVCRQEA